MERITCNNNVRNEKKQGIPYRLFYALHIGFVLWINHEHLIHEQYNPNKSCASLNSTFKRVNNRVFNWNSITQIFSIIHIIYSVSNFTNQSTEPSQKLSIYLQGFILSIFYSLPYLSYTGEHIYISDNKKIGRPLQIVFCVTDFRSIYRQAMRYS